MQRIFDDAIHRLLPNMNENDHDILIEKAITIVEDIQSAFNVTDTAMLLQLQATKYRDAMAIITMLIPRIEDDKAQNISSLSQLFNEHFNNVQWGRCVRDANGRYKKDREWNILYLESNFNLLRQSIQTVSHKLHPNWIDVTPIPLLKYQTSSVFKETHKVFYPHNIDFTKFTDINFNFDYKWNTNRRDAIKQYKTNNTKNAKEFTIVTPPGSLSIRDMWSVVSGELFEQVLSQKLLIHDYNYDDTIGEPITALFIWDRLMPLDNAYDQLRWADSSDDYQLDFTKKWNLFIEHARRRTAYVFETNPKRLAISSTTILRMMRNLADVANDYKEHLFRDTEWEDKYVFDVIKAPKAGEVLDNNDIGKQQLHGDADWGKNINAYKDEIDYVLSAIENIPAQAWYMVLSKAVQGIQLSWYGLMLFEKNSESGSYRPIKIDYPRDTRSCTTEELEQFNLGDNIKDDYDKNNNDNSKEKVGALAVMRNTMRRSGCPIIMPFGKDNKCFITVKNIYNWAKSVTHHTYIDPEGNKDNNLFINLTRHWDMIELQSNSKNSVFKKKNVTDMAVDRLFGCTDQENHGDAAWLNLSTYHNAIYTNYTGQSASIELSDFHITLIYTATMLLPHIVTQALIKRGTLTQLIPRPDITNEAHYGDSEEKRGEWLQANLAANNGPLSKSKRKDYESAYNFVNGLEYDKIYLARLATDRHMNWYTLYAMNWVSQISLYHRFLNCRFGMITGATGVGKSTQAPKLMLYALRALEGRSRANVVCTEPRTDITRKNAIEVADQMGVPLEQFSENTIGNGKPEKEESGHKGVGYKFKGNDIGRGAPIQLSFITDGSLLKPVLSCAMLKTARRKLVKEVNKNTDKKPEYKLSEENLYDIFMIDEAHEHNINMDLILSRMRPHLYHNTEIRFYTISATLTAFDEKRYRNFFRDINDNYRYPFRLLPEGSDRIDMERLIHIAAPFMGTRYTITHIPPIEVLHGRKLTDPSVMRDVIAEATKIAVKLSHTNSHDRNDVIIFLPGAREIMECCTAINNSPELGTFTIAIPYYKSLHADVRNLMSKIDKPDSRDKIVWGRNDTINLLQSGDLDNAAGYPIGKSYKQFILVATNIAEASLTISTLRYVIDSGMAKSVTYSPVTRTEKMENTMISKFNSTQRVGRVGRTMLGTAYYLYNKELLEEGSLENYAITSGNLSDAVVELLNTSIYEVNYCMGTSLDLLNTDTVKYRKTPIKDKFMAAMTKQWFLYGQRIDTINTGITEHQGIKDLEEGFKKYMDSHYNSAPMAFLILDYEMRIYCFHPEEPYLTRDKSGTVTNVNKSTSRNIMFKERVLRKVHTNVILSPLLDDSILRLVELGMLEQSYQKVTDFDRDLRQANTYKILGTHDGLHIIPLNNSVLKLTDLGKQVQAITEIISDEIPPDEDLQFTMNDIIFLLYSHRYGCIREALMLITTLWVCSSAAGPNLSNWAPMRIEKNKKTGRMMHIMNFEEFFAKYRHDTSDHLALLRVARAIDPLYRKVFGDAMDRKSRIVQDADNDIKKEYRRLLAFKPYVTVKAGIVTVDASRTSTFGSNEIRELRKIINDLEEYPSDPTQAFERFSIRKKAQYLRKRSDDFYDDPYSYKNINRFAEQNTLSTHKVHRYMNILQFLQIGINNLISISKMPDEVKLRKYPTTDPSLLTLESKMYIFSADTKEQGLMRSYLYANPEKIAMLGKNTMYYKHNVSLMTSKLFNGSYNGFSQPHGLCLFSGMAETSKLADVDVGIEVVSSTLDNSSNKSNNSMDNANEPIKAGIIASVFTNIPSKWLGQCNPIMNYDTGFLLNNIERRSSGLSEFHSGVMQGVLLDLNPWH